MTDPRAMSNGELAERLHAQRWGIGHEMHDLICESARRLREHADLEAACDLLGEECRAQRSIGGYSVVRIHDAIARTDAHPTAAQYVKPKETTDGH